MSINKGFFEEYKTRVEQLGKITELGWEIRVDVGFWTYSSLWMKDESGNTLTIPLPAVGMNQKVSLEDQCDEAEALVRIILERTFEDWETLWIHDKPVEVYQSWNKARQRLPCKKKGLMNWYECYLHPNTVDPVYHI